MTSENVMEILQEDYKYLIDRFGESRILGVFAGGDINWGISPEKFNTLHTAALYLPTFEELCFDEPQERKEVITRTKSEIFLVDFRWIYKSAIEGKCFLTESLYTNYYICTEKYKDIYNKYLRGNRDKIVTHNRIARLNILLTKGIESLKEGMSLPIVNKKAKAEAIFKGVKYFQFARAFADHKSYEESINSVTRTTKEILDLPDWLEDKIKVENFCTSYIKCAEILRVEVNYLFNFTIGKDALLELHSAVLKIMKLADSNSELCIDFLGKITANEREALHIIYQEIGYEGTVPVSKLLEKSLCSRPVFMNLFKKMQTYNVAKIENKGSAGTYIKITEPSIIEKFD